MSTSFDLTKEAGVVLLRSIDWTAGVGISKVDSKVFVCCATHIKSWRMAQSPDGNVLSFSPLDDIPVQLPHVYPFLIACSPTDHKAYMSCMGGPNAKKVLVLNTRTNEFVDAPESPTLLGVAQMAFSADGKKCYFPNRGDLLVTDETAGGVVSNSISVATIYTQWVATMKNGKYIYVGGQLGDNAAPEIAVVDAQTEEEVDLVHGLHEPVYTFDVNASDTELYVSTRNGLDVVDTRSNQRIKKLRDGGWVGQVACSKVSPRACLIDPTAMLQGDWPLQFFDTVTNEMKPFETRHSSDSTAFLTFDHYGNAYVGTEEGVAVIHHARIDALFG